MNTIIDDRQMRALTGLDMAAFCALAAPFAGHRLSYSRQASPKILFGNKSIVIVTLDA